MADDLTALEERIAHLQKTVDEMSDVAARQDRELAVLQRRVEMLLRREAEREADAATAPPADQRPPHY